ncbi:GIY-YIG nuclease family protein [Noviherbaspirillum sp. CPCC 100848]|uniref:GIY-YIG nuclease family protein n=1 Tax=Noviherbaspirillum album TaxID=3080276 RepID=A0ABU6JJA7_9BURK|nr:GIY-YIG nuclease family protein [Noviherbaspirillum sp. CPCC 100848]MEC4723546.1 GIY-YIG nuclease family protein [Noviherbaspirillum sp. CPCC 100848]
MTNDLTRLESIGFAHAGKWALTSRGLEAQLDPNLAAGQNALYAFVVNGTLTYIGKTTKTLKERMQGYKTPAVSAERGGSTNIKNNRNIVEVLSNGGCVDIYAFINQGEQKHRGFLINLAAGLEDVLIKELSPPWNGRQFVISTEGTDQLKISKIGTVETLPATMSDACADIAASRSNTPIPSHKSPIKYNLRAKNESRLTKADFENMLRRTFTEATNVGEDYIDIRSGDLHTRVGVYPSKGHSMPTCCTVMYDAMKPGDTVLQAPPKGKGANVVVRYQLPR